MNYFHCFSDCKLSTVLMLLFVGIGRIIMDSNIVPDVIPIWLFGMDDILPNKRPYIPKVGQVLVL